MITPPTIGLAPPLNTNALLTLPAYPKEEQSTKLVDKQGRILSKLRLSITDACQFHCFYCLPKPLPFLPSQKILTVEEFFYLTSQFVSLGVNTLRVTGGEPTIHPQFITIMEKLSKLKPSSSHSFLKLTTNGEKLGEYLPQLFDLGCHSINISLDSLDPYNFQKITGRKTFATVIDNILKAKNMGFQVKINVVVAKNYNDHEIIPFVKFSENEGLSVRFLELMNLGPIKPIYTESFISACEIKSVITEYTELKPLVRDLDSTSQDYSTTQGGSLGFIAPETEPFCSGCSRLRLSAEGVFRSCLMHETGVNLRGLSPTEIKTLIGNHIHTKPLTKIIESPLSMSKIGG